MEVFGEALVLIRPRLEVAEFDRGGRLRRVIRGGATGVAMTDYLEAALLNEVLRATNYAAPAAVYAGLTTAQATPETGLAGVTEVTGSSYARQAMAFAAPDASSTCANSGTVTFPVCTGSPYTVTGVILVDAASAGNVLLYGTLAASKTIAVGDAFIFAAGAVTVQFD